MGASVLIEVSELDLWRRWFYGQTTFEEALEQLDRHYPLVCLYDEDGLPLRDPIGNPLVSKGVLHDV